MMERARRPISSHPAFAPLLALWFAALLGLGVVVLPPAILERVIGMVGLAEAIAPTPAGRLAASGAAAVAGALVGLGLAALLARRGRHGPHPYSADAETLPEEPVAEAPIRRPLHVREELDEGLGQAEVQQPQSGMIDAPDGAEAEADREVARPAAAEPGDLATVRRAVAEEGFMILSPQPTHPPLHQRGSGPDLDALLAQFDNALAAFRSEPERDRGAAEQKTGEESGSAEIDAVRAFVARQTGAPTAPEGSIPPAGASGHSPLGGRIPDHQGELRAALDKLARAHRKD